MSLRGNGLNTGRLQNDNIQETDRHTHNMRRDEHIHDIAVHE